MLKLILTLGSAAVLVLHGLIHLMGTTVYMRLGALDGFPYKTTLLGGVWEVGAAGIWLFGLLWLLAGAGTVAAGLGLPAHVAWARPVLLAAALLSLAICGLDWGLAWRGALIDIGILVALALTARLGQSSAALAG